MISSDLDSLIKYISALITVTLGLIIVIPHYDKLINFFKNIVNSIIKRRQIKDLTVNNAKQISDIVNIQADLQKKVEWTTNKIDKLETKINDMHLKNKNDDRFLYNMDNKIQLILDYISCNNNEEKLKLINEEYKKREIQEMMWNNDNYNI